MFTLPATPIVARLPGIGLECPYCIVYCAIYLGPPPETTEYLLGLLLLFTDISCLSLTYANCLEVTEPLAETMEVPLLEA